MDPNQFHPGQIINPNQSTQAKTSIQIIPALPNHFLKSIKPSQIILQNHQSKSF